MMTQARFLDESGNPISVSVEAGQTLRLHGDRVYLNGRQVKNCTVVVQAQAKPRYATQLTAGDVRRIRARAEMTREEFAEELGLTPQTVGRMESGKHTIRRVTAMAVRFFELHYLGGPES